jgi:hypothetical protein
LVERYYLETLNHLRALVYDRLSHKNWRVLLPLVQRILNAQDLPAIGCSPNQLLFGYAIDTNQGIFLEFTKKEQEQLSIGEYMCKLIGEQARLIKKAQELLHSHDRTHAQKGGDVTVFAVNSYVLVRYPPSFQRRSQPPTMLHTNLRGPLKITNRDGDSN